MGAIPSEFEVLELSSVTTSSKRAGSEINIFRQAPLATDNFFAVARWKKCGRQKVSLKFFLSSETKMDGKLWSPIFSFNLRIRTKRTRLGPH